MDDRADYRNMPDGLSLKDKPLLHAGLREPVFLGNQRAVYQHPRHNHLLIKVIRPERIGEDGNIVRFGIRRFAKRRSFGVYSSFEREIREMLRAGREAIRSPGYEPPFSKVYGLIETPLGLGLVVEKIAAPDGELAPTLERLIADHRYTDHHARKLDEFFVACRRHHVVMNDVRPNNLVFDERHGGRFLCIDGMGEKVFVPIHQWSRLANHWSLRRAERRLRHRINSQLTMLGRKHATFRLDGQSGSRDQDKTEHFR